MQVLRSTASSLPTLAGLIPCYTPYSLHLCKCVSFSTAQGASLVQKKSGEVARQPTQPAKKPAFCHTFHIQTWIWIHPSSSTFLYANIFQDIPLPKNMIFEQQWPTSKLYDLCSEVEALLLLVGQHSLLASCCSGLQGAKPSLEMQDSGKLIRTHAERNQNQTNMTH